jgi:hypothetical protein
MSRPFSSDYADARVLPDPPPQITYRVTYTVTTPAGEQVTGYGQTVAPNDSQAQTYALGLLYALCRPCDCYSGHTATVERIK